MRIADCGLRIDSADFGLRLRIVDLSPAIANRQSQPAIDNVKMANRQSQSSIRNLKIGNPQSAVRNRQRASKVKLEGDTPAPASS
jgi:hypothetical protein